MAHVTDVPFDLFSLGINIITGHIQCSGCWIREPAKNPNRSGFPRPVCTKKSEYLSFFNLKSQVIIRNKVTELFDKVFDGYYVIVVWHWV
jgi:hypothetical protein